MGSDSAPHPLSSKLPASHSKPACAAGIYTAPHLIPLVATLFESIEPTIPLDRLSGYVSDHGRAWYGFPADPKRSVTLKRLVEPKTLDVYQFDKEDGAKDVVVPFWKDRGLSWELVR
jgi:dihydroorotase